MIPDYQSLMLPLIKLLSDGQSHSKPELVAALGIQFKLSSEELNELLPNSKRGRKIFNIGYIGHWRI